MEANDIGKLSWKQFNIFFRKGTEDENVLSHSFDNDIFYKEIPSFKPSDNPIFFDIGAHIGTFSLLTAQKYPNSKIIGFEASKETFDLFKLNIESNSIINIKGYHKAVAAVEGEIKLYHSKDSGNWGHSITSKLSDSSEIVQAVNLSKFIEDHKINKIDLIKFNCEGAEFEIINSLTDKQISSYVRAGLVLYHQDLVAGINQLNLLVKRFDSLNFRIKLIEKSPERGWLIVWNRRFYSKRYFFLNAAKRRIIKWFG